MRLMIDPPRCIQCNARLPEQAEEYVVLYDAVFVQDPRLCPDCRRAPALRRPLPDERPERPRRHRV